MDAPLLVVMGVCAGAAILALAVLTAVGHHRRGHETRHAVAAGLFFPITWVVWYVMDAEHRPG